MILGNINTFKNCNLSSDTLMSCIEFLRTVSKDTPNGRYELDNGIYYTVMDASLSSAEGKLLHQIIEARGMDGFLAIEDEVNCGISAKNSVIATGGSVVYCERAMEHLCSLGKVVYLYVPFEEMKRRLGDFSHRGVIMRSGNDLYDMYAERAPLYEKYADITVDVCRAELNDSLVKICEALTNE